MLNLLTLLYLGAFKLSCSAELSMKKSFKTLGPELERSGFNYFQGVKQIIIHEENKAAH